jgi:hypothetical protein
MPYVRYILSHVLSFQKSQIHAETPRVSLHDENSMMSLSAYLLSRPRQQYSDDECKRCRHCHCPQLKSRKHDTAIVWFSTSVMLLMAAFAFLLAPLVLVLSVSLVKNSQEDWDNAIHIFAPAASISSNWIGSEQERRNLHAFPFYILEGDDDDATPSPPPMIITHAQMLNAASALGCICAAALSGGLTMGDYSIQFSMAQWLIAYGFVYNSVFIHAMHIFVCA